MQRFKRSYLTVERNHVLSLNRALKVLSAEEPAGDSSRYRNEVSAVRKGEIYLLTFL